MTIGSNIKKFRKERGLTQIQLAQKANISRSYLADVEGDRYNPSIDTLESISNALNVPVSSILGEQEMLDIELSAAELNNQILTVLRLLVNDEGYFFEELREDAFNAIVESLNMSVSFHNSSDHIKHEEFFKDYFSSPEDLSDRQHKEANEDFNSTYNIRTVKTALEATKEEKRVEFLSKLNDILNKYKIKAPSLKESAFSENEYILFNNIKEIVNKHEMSLDDPRTFELIDQALDFIKRMRSE